MENRKTRHKNIPDWLRIEALSAGIIAYEWDTQTGAFTIDDYSGVLGPAAGEVRLTRPSWEALLHPDDKVRTSEAFQRHLRRESPAIVVAYRIRTIKGCYTWFMDRSSVVEWTKTGDPLRIAGVLGLSQSQIP